MLNPEILRLLGPGRSLMQNRASWARIEGSLGKDLPMEFKEFVNRYGAGTIDGEFQISDVDGIEQYMDSFGAPALLSRERGEIPADVQIRPEIGGIMFWATSASGDIVYLRPVEDALWHVCVLTQSGGWTEIQSTFQVFLERFLENTEASPFGLKWKASRPPRWRQ